MSYTFMSCTFIMLTGKAFVKQVNSPNQITSCNLSGGDVEVTYKLCSEFINYSSFYFLWLYYAININESGVHL